MTSNVTENLERQINDTSLISNPKNVFFFSETHLFVETKTNNETVSNSYFFLQGKIELKFFCLKEKMLLQNMIDVEIKFKF